VSTPGATKYAQGLVQAALGTWLEQLAAVQRNIRRSPDLATTLNDPNALPTERESAVGRIVPATAAPEVVQFVRLLARQGDLNQLDEILRTVRATVPALEETANALVTSAHELSSAEKEQLEQKLRRDHGADTRVAFEVDPELLGGLRIRIGDRIIDHTVASRLDALRQRLVT
jgi:F-type H+-transporting ATPase subunit delta